MCCPPCAMAAWTAARPRCATVHENTPESPIAARSQTWGWVRVGEGASESVTLAPSARKADPPLRSDEARGPSGRKKKRSLLWDNKRRGMHQAHRRQNPDGFAQAAMGRSKRCTG